MSNILATSSILTRVDAMSMSLKQDVFTLFGICKVRRVKASVLSILNHPFQFMHRLGSFAILCYHYDSLTSSR